MTKALEMHKMWKGKIEVISRCKVENSEDLSLAYTPGVAEPCLEIAKDSTLSYTYTRRHNLVAVISDGSAVLGLGNIGGLAGMPVMEGKCALFKKFADVDAFPIVLNVQDTQSIIQTIKAISPSFGGINLEDISAPRCFEIENSLKKELDIPVFHDDQHGTAIVVLAAINNGLKLVKKQLGDIKVVVVGAGAAGSAIGRLLVKGGVGELIMVDKNGILCEGDNELNYAMADLAKITNRNMIKGSLSDAMQNADIVIGVSGPNTIKPEMVKLMAKNAMVFAMSNPNPEILPQLAKDNGAMIVGTGRSDYPNQINNVLAFPGIFRGALDARASSITENMKLAAANAISQLISDDELSVEYILPKAFDKRVGNAVAKAVYNQANIDGVNRI